MIKNINKEYINHLVNCKYDISTIEGLEKAEKAQGELYNIFWNVKQKLINNDTLIFEVSNQK